MIFWNFEHWNVFVQNWPTNWSKVTLWKDFNLLKRLHFPLGNTPSNYDLTIFEFESNLLRQLNIADRLIFHKSFFLLSIMKHLREMSLVSFFAYSFKKRAAKMGEMLIKRLIENIWDNLSCFLTMMSKKKWVIQPPHFSRLPYKKNHPSFTRFCLSLFLSLFLSLSER